MHRLNKYQSSRGERGIAIVLPLKWFRHCEMARGFLLVTITRDHEDVNSRMHIEIKLQLNLSFKNF